MKILEILSTGYGLIVDAYVQPREYVRPSGDEFVYDNASLRGDVRMVGNDMRGAMANKHVERAYQRQGH